MKLHLYIIASLIAVPLLGCTSLISRTGPIKGNLDRSGAGDLIQNSAQFKKPKTIFLSERRQDGGCEYLNADTIERRLERAGLVELKTTEAKSLLARGDCDLVLTDAGKKESFQRNDTIWVIAVADRELSQVTGITGGDKDAAEVEYTWRWTPNSFCEKTNCQTAKALAGPVFSQEERALRRSTARFRKYDDGWRLESCGC